MVSRILYTWTYRLEVMEWMRGGQIEIAEMAMTVATKPRENTNDGFTDPGVDGQFTSTSQTPASLRTFGLPSSLTRLSSPCRECLSKFCVT